MFIVYIISAFHCAADAFNNKEHINVEAVGICYCIKEPSCYKITPKDMLQLYIKDKISTEALRHTFEITLR